MIHMLKLADIVTWQRCCYNFAQRHKGKYTFNNCTNRKSQQRNRNYKTDPNRNFRTKSCNIWNKGGKSLAVFNRLEMIEESENIEDKSIEIIQSEGLRGKKRMSWGVIHILLTFSRKREWGYLPPPSKRLHWDYIQTTGPN